MIVKNGPFERKLTYIPEMENYLAYRNCTKLLNALFYVSILRLKLPIKVCFEINVRYENVFQTFV